MLVTLKSVRFSETLHRVPVFLLFTWAWTLWITIIPLCADPVYYGVNAPKNTPHFVSFTANRFTCSIWKTAYKDKRYGPVTLSRTASPNIKILYHQSVRFGRRTTNRNVLEMNMGRLSRTRNEHKTGQSTLCYRMSIEHKHDKRTNERVKRTDNKCLPDTTNIQRKKNE